MFPAICGSATFAKLVSSTSMKAASETTNAISQGLAFGFHAIGLLFPASAKRVVNLHQREPLGKLRAGEIELRRKVVGLAGQNFQVAGGSSLVPKIAQARGVL